MRRLSGQTLNGREITIRLGREGRELEDAQQHVNEFTQCAEPYWLIDSADFGI